MLMALVQTRRQGLKQDSLTSIVSTSDGSIGVAVETASDCVGAAACMLPHAPAHACAHLSIIMIDSLQNSHPLLSLVDT
jgi:hypothetical protein